MIRSKQKTKQRKFHGNTTDLQTIPNKMLQKTKCLVTQETVCTSPRKLK